MSGQQRKYPLQTKFWKSFGRYGIFLGTVVGYDAVDGVYKCYYEGDGDEECLTEEEIGGWLKRYPSVAKTNNGAANKKKRTSDKQPDTKERARKSCPEKQSRKGPLKEVAAKKEKECDALEERWKQNFQKIKAFREAHGHACVPRSQDPGLGQWVRNQRQKCKKGTIQPHRRALLENMGFGFCPEIRSWDKSYQLLVNHKKMFGGFSNLDQKGLYKRLAYWIKARKRLNQEGRLRSGRKKLLEKLGLDITMKQKRTFAENFRLLLDFQKIHGHTNVPQHYQDKTLAHFVAGKRKQYQTNHMPPHQKEELEKIGFQFRLEKPRRTWQENFDALASYKKKHGNCDVSRRYKKDTRLAAWVGNLKTPQRFKALDLEQKGQLNAIGFRPNQEAPKPRNSLKSNLAALHVSKSKKHNAATSTRSNQAIFQPSNQPTKFNRAAKQRARLKIENQLDQETSDDESASGVDSYNSDECCAMEESMPSFLDDATSSMGEDVATDEIGDDNQADCPEKVSSSQEREGCSGPEVAPNKAESSAPPAQTTGTARRSRNGESARPHMAPAIARSASNTSTDVSSSDPTHRRQTSRAKAVAQTVPDTIKSGPHGEPIVPDVTESSSTSARTTPRKRRKKTQQEEEESDKNKPRWLFDQ